MPENRIPEVGDRYYPDMKDMPPEVVITEVGDLIQHGEFIGRSVVIDNEIWVDCFWSDKHQRFQYFPDGK